MYSVGDWIIVVKRSKVMNPHINNLGYIGRIVEISGNAAQIQCTNGGTGAVDIDCLVPYRPAPEDTRLYDMHFPSSYQEYNISDNKKFQTGDTVTFDPDSFNKEYWDELTMDQKKRYYGDIYNFDDPSKPFLFTFICEHSPQVGHCVLINMQNQRVETMRHTSDFRLVEDDEC